MRAAMVSIAGMSVGIFVHVVAAATGLAALLASSATAFLIIKYIGAAYLIYLGLKIWFQSSTKITRSKIKTPNASESYFFRGILVDLLNPKIGLFFIAFLPQFVETSGRGTFVHTMLLGMLFIIIGAIVNSCIAAITVQSMLIAKPKAKKWIEKWIPGVVLIGLGVRLASEEA